MTTRNKIKDQCKLCKNIGPILMSHIIPRWAYRRLIKLNSKIEPNPILVSNKTALLVPKQAAEYLLCENCEKLIAQPERYVASITRRDDGSFPALQSAQIYLENKNLMFAVGNAPEIDIDAVSKFAAGVIWRSSVSSIYQKTRLGPYEGPFSDYLQGKKNFPARSHLIVEIIRRMKPPHVDRLIVLPESQRDGAFHVHKFCLFGMVFRLYVGNNIPNEIDAFSFSDKGLVLITDGRLLEDSISQVLRESKPKGSLAKSST